MPLHEGDNYIRLLRHSAEQVSEVAAASEPRDGRCLRDCFATLTFDADHGTGHAQDIAYTRTFLPGLKNFHRTAAQNDRAAIFTVDH
ncbi:hypothetical protein ACIQMV_24910 [Streptomyces sp. NPDC091412]|uniref:hypothetical protein n=1 Tax=Streptomyces sp. NPDC091412 TaxID=3366002 RepID=UPI00381FB585